MTSEKRDQVFDRGGPIGDAKSRFRSPKQRLDLCMMVENLPEPVIAT